MRVVGCFLEHGDKFVILLRHGHKPDGNTWGLPSGKVEAGENDIEAAVRELEEETGYKAHPSELEHLGDFDFVSSSSQPYVYATYRASLKDLHEVRLEDAAHAEFEWVTAKSCNTKPNLIPGFHELLRLTGHIK